MSDAKFNIGLLVRTAILVMGLGLLTHFVHGFQMKQHAAEQLVLANAAQAEEKGDELVAALSRYLAFDPTDKEIRTRYALTLADRASDPRQRWRALQVLRQSMFERVSQPEIRLRAAQLALALNEPRDALDYLNDLVRRHPNTVEAYVLIAQCQEMLGNTSATLRALERVLEIAPDHTESARKLATLLRNRQGQAIEAQAVMDRLVRKNPYQAAAYLARARYLIETGKSEDAVADLKRARDLSPKDLEVISISADLQRRRGFFQEASGLYRQAIALNPKNLVFYLQGARCEEELGNRGEEIAILKQGLKPFADNIDLLLALGDAQIASGNLIQAEELRKRLPASAKAINSYLGARISQAKRLWLEASSQFIQTLLLGSLSDELLGRLMFHLARCYDALEIRDEQQLALQEAVALRPTVAARVALANQLVVMGRGEKAMRLLEQVTKVPSAPDQAWLLLVRVLLERNALRTSVQRDWSEVRAVFARAEHVPGLAGKLAPYQARFHIIRNKPREALLVLEHAKEAYPWEMSIPPALAHQYREEGKSKEARRMMLEADRRFGNQLPWLLRRADALAELADSTAYEELLRLGDRGNSLPALDRDLFQRHLIRLQMRLGNTEEAQHLCGELLSRQPYDLMYRYITIQTFLAQNNLQTAQIWFDELKKLEGEQGAIWRCAEVAMMLGRRENLNGEQARKLLSQARKLRPQWSEPVLLEARLDERENNLVKAAINYQLAVDLGDDGPVAMRRALELRILEGRYLELVPMIDLVTRRGTLQPSLYRAVADVLVRTDRRQRARELTNQAVPPDSRSYRDLLWRGRLLDRIHLSTEAEETFLQAVRLAPDATEPWLVLIHFYFRQGQISDARETLNEMKTKLASDRREVALARGYEILGEFPRSTKLYENILAKHPRDVSAIQQLIRLHIRLNHPLQAEPLLQQLLDPQLGLQPELLPPIRRQLALVLTAPEQTRDRTKEALALLTRNLEEMGSNERDEISRNLVDWREVRNRIRSLKSLAGIPVLTLLPEERLRLAHMYDTDGDWTAARRHLLDLVDLDENNPAYPAALVNGLIRHQKIAEANRWLDTLRRQEPNSVRTKELTEQLRRLENGIK